MHVDHLAHAFPEAEEREFLREMVDADLEEAENYTGTDDRFIDDAEAYANVVGRQKRRVAFLRELQGGLEASSGQ